MIETLNWIVAHPLAAVLIACALRFIVGGVRA